MPAPIHGVNLMSVLKIRRITMKLYVALLLLVVAVVVEEAHGQREPVEPCLAWMKPQPTCPPNERYTCCKSCFEPTCRTRNVAVKCAQPCAGGCICRNGYIRVVSNGKCVPLYTCGRLDIIFPEETE
uniref:TIL domain-containing protein n=1 Tax=Anopheles maculatus TaxID=74869 RepID=A0A182TAM0_9DIPT